MKFLTSLLACAFGSGILPSTAAEKLARLTFSDHTTLSGEIIKVDAGARTLTLRSPNLEGDTILHTKELLEIELGESPLAQEADHYAIVTSKPRYDNRPKDSIRGTLSSIDDKTITLETWYAGKLSLNRPMVGSLNIFAKSPSVYHGPNSLEGWVSSNGKLEEAWVFKNRKLISKERHGIARKVTFPEQARITFTAKWKNSPQFNVAFLSKDGESNFPAVAYRLTMQSNSLSLSRNGPGNNREDVINHTMHSMRNLGQEEAIFEIYLNRERTGDNALFIDGVRQGSWTNTDDTEGMGEWLHFIPQNNRPLEISNISVGHWNGQLPEGKLELADRDDDLFEGLEGEKIDLSNGDTMIGTIQKVDGKLLEAKTIYGEVAIPLARVRAIDVAGPVKDEPQPIMQANEIRAWFHEGGYLHLKVLEMDRTTVRGTSQVFGEATFQLSAFSRLEFNIWRPALDLGRYGKRPQW